VSAGSEADAGSALLRLLDILVPSLCLVCEAPRRTTGGGGVCERCWESLPRLSPETCCPRCALPNRGGLCPACRVERPPISSAAAYASYEGITAALVGAYKFRGFDILAEPAGRRLAALVKERGLDDADALVPIPSTRRRNRERGYDPSVLLGRAAACALSLPFRRLLRRTRQTLPQSSLPAARRAANVRGAFAASAQAAGRALLLVDDVVTTGATARAAAEALRSAGARRVDLLAFARTPEPNGLRRTEGE
jgi:ComF family protein